MKILDQARNFIKTIPDMYHSAVDEHFMQRYVLPAPAGNAGYYLRTSQYGVMGSLAKNEWSIAFESILPDRIGTIKENSLHFSDTDLPVVIQPLFSPRGKSIFTTQEMLTEVLRLMQDERLSDQERADGQRKIIRRQEINAEIETYRAKRNMPPVVREARRATFH